jgi:hypothetical protein
METTTTTTTTTTMTMTMIQFEPFSSAVDAAFWHQLSEKKVSEFRLDDSSKPLVGYYSLGSPAVVAVNPAAARDGAGAATHASSTTTTTTINPPPRLCLGVSAFGQQLTE